MLDASSLQYRYPFSKKIILVLILFFNFWENKAHPKIIIYIYIYILLFKGLPVFGFLFFLGSKMPYTPLCLSREKIKGKSGKNTTLNPTKILPKKQDYSPVIFFFFENSPINTQIALSTYKLDP